MAKEVKGYKVVRTNQFGGHTRFLSAGIFAPDWIVAYTPGTPTYGRGDSPVFGFDSLPHAKKFTRFRGSRIQIWEAHLGKPKLRKRLCKWTHHYLKFWSRERKGVDTFSAPVGTVACESITLLRQVV